MDKLQTRRTLDSQEAEEVHDLAQICNQHDQISLDDTLNIPLLRSQDGETAKSFLFYIEKKLIGFLSMSYPSGKKEVVVSGMVHPEARRGKVATRLLAEARKEWEKNRSQRKLVICDHSSISGREFLSAVGATYQFSVCKMIYDLTGSSPLPNKTLDLRPIESYDFPSARSILMKCFSCTEEEAQQMIENGMNGRGHWMYIAKLGLWSLGTIMVTSDGTEISLHGLAVQPNFQGKGYGKQILLQCIEHVRRNGEKPIKLEVQVDNLKRLGFYQSCGFRETSITDYYLW